ncbi:hypothetical protein NE237_014516 [Protea cynaroides]|uniref:Uncharacterized protein n=1 Tax=Protea cynaroides TaxID=273540 RepID=A0A9Q0QQ64_9MAGN|nr:hypothetical protein NE237_014516 [Protea cynaroides]
MWERSGNGGIPRFFTLSSSLPYPSLALSNKFHGFRSTKDGSPASVPSVAEAGSSEVPTIVDQGCLRLYSDVAFGRNQQIKSWDKPVWLAKDLLFPISVISGEAFALKFGLQAAIKLESGNVIAFSDSLTLSPSFSVSVMLICVLGMYYIYNLVLESYKALRERALLECILGQEYVCNFVLETYDIFGLHERKGSTNNLDRPKHLAEGAYDTPSDPLPEVEDSDGIVQNFTAGNPHDSINSFGKLK